MVQAGACGAGEEEAHEEASPILTVCVPKPSAAGAPAWAGDGGPSLHSSSWPGMARCTHLKHAHQQAGRTHNAATSVQPNLAPCLCRGQATEPCNWSTRLEGCAGLATWALVACCHCSSTQACLAGGPVCLRLGRMGCMACMGCILSLRAVWRVFKASTFHLCRALQAQRCALMAAD